MLKRKEKQQRRLIAHDEPKSPISEQYRNIRTNIDFASVDQELRTLLVTSSNPGEGKTTTTANLATVFAQQGKRILLIDADMRKPTMQQLFQVDNYMGLTSVLAKKAQLGECIRRTMVPNLDFLPAGAIPPNPAELLGSHMIRQLIQAALTNYDMVIFDTPPILAVTDAQVLANQCDGMILVIRSGRTDKQAALRAKSLLQNSKAKLLGTVLNGKKQDSTTYYYYYGND